MSDSKKLGPRRKAKEDEDDEGSGGLDLFGVVGDGGVAGAIALKQELSKEGELFINGNIERDWDGKTEKSVSAGVRIKW